MKPKRYPGSKPFTLAEKGLFFGREKDIEGLYNFICVEKLSVLYGKSGLGKTSLLNAGVIPKLEEERNFEVVQVRFGSYFAGCNRAMPLESFEDQVKIEHSESFLNKVESENITLWQHLKNREDLHPDTDSTLIVIDQFEELFTYPSGIEAFAEELARLQSGRMPPSFRKKLRDTMESNPEWITDDQWDFLKRPLRLKILLSIRSDKMGLLNRLAPYIPNILRDCYELLPLTREQAESAIVKPAIADGDFASSCFSYEKISLDKILDYLTQNNEKNVESFQLQILCQYVEENIVIKQQDTSISPDDLGDLENIYQNYYNHHIDLLGTKEERQAARVLIEEGLIFEKEERRLTLYQGQIYSAYKISEDLLQRLVNTHIIRSIPDSSGGYSYEISHDTLVGPILRSKEKRKEQERIEEEQRQMEEEERKQRELAAKQQRRFLMRAGITALCFIGLFAAIGYLASINRTIDAAKTEAEMVARSGELIIKSMQLQDDATVALRLAQKAFELSDRKNMAILDIIGEYYTNSSFYKETYNHRLGVGAAAFDPSGAFVLTGSDDFTARLWNLNGEEVECLRGHTGQIKSVAFSADSVFMLTGSSDGTAKLWKRNNGRGELLQTFEGHKGTVYAVAFSPTADTILTAGKDKTARLWDKDGNELEVFEGHKGMILAAIYGPKGDKIYTASTDGMVKSWNISNNGGRTFQLPAVPLNSLALSPKGDVLIGGTNDGRVIQWRENGSRIAELNPHSSDITFVAFSPTGDSILSGSLDKTVLLWKIGSRGGDEYVQELKRLDGHTDFTRAGAFSPNGRYVITASNDHTAKVWNLQHEDIDHYQVPDFKEGSSLRFSAGGGQLVIGEPDGNLLWMGVSAKNARDTIHFPEPHRKAVTDISCTSRAGFIVTASEDSTAILWQIVDRNIKKRNTFVRHTAPLTSVDIFLGRRGEDKVEQAYILTASEDSTAILWNEKAEPLMTFRGHQGVIRKVAFSPDGSRVLTAGDDRTARIWTTDGEEENRLVGHSRAITDAAFSKDGNMVLTSSKDRSARLWDMRNGLEIAALKGHDDEVTHVAFAVDSFGNNSFVLTGSKDGTAREWSLNGREMKRVDVHQSPLGDVRFSVAGDYLLTVDESGWFQKSYALLSSLQKGDIDELSYVQLNQYGVLNDTSISQIPYEELNREDIRGYAYWYLQKTDKTINRDRLNYLLKSADIFRKLLQKPGQPNVIRQDKYELALVFVYIMETQLYLNESNLIQETDQLTDSIRSYAPELYREAIPYLYAARLLNDSARATTLYNSLFQSDSLNLLGQIQEKIWLMRSLEKISTRFKTEYPGVNVSPIDSAQVRLNRNLVPEGQLASDGSNTPENGRLASKEMSEDEKQKFLEAAEYFKEAAIQSSSNSQKELYFRYSLKLYQMLPYRDQVRHVFDIYKELGYVYTESSEIDPLLDEALQRDEHAVFARRKGFILTDLSLFNAYMQTSQPEKAKALISKYPQDLVNDLMPAITKYMDFWIGNGGRKTNFEAEISEEGK